MMIVNLKLKSLASFFSIISLALLILLSNQTSSTVRSQEINHSFSIKAEPGRDPGMTEKGYFLFSSKSGSSVSGQVRLTNPTDDSITVSLSFVDSLTSDNGGSAFETDEVQSTGISRWMKIGEPIVTIAAHSDVLVDFLVTIPDDVMPGQYLAGLAASEVPADVSPGSEDAEPKTAGATVTMRTRYVIGVEIDIPGDWVPSLLVDGVTLIDHPSGPIVGIEMTNDGDTFLRPTGSIEITGNNADPVISQSIELGTFVTGTSIVYPVAWQGEIQPGTYQVKVNLDYADDQKVSFTGEITFDENAGSASSVKISAFSIDEVRNPSTNQLQVVEIALTIDNPGITVVNSELKLLVERDGIRVEDLSLGTELTFPLGTAHIQQRYVPISGWVAGSYTFSVVLSTIEPATGTSIILTSHVAEDPIVVV